MVLGIFHPLVCLHACLTQGLRTFHTVAGSRSIILTARAALICILGVGRSLAATVPHEVILHNVFGEALLLTNRAVDHCKVEEGRSLLSRRDLDLEPGPPDS